MNVDIEFLDYDIVILGSGFAGLRAAYSACVQNLGQRICVLSLEGGPGGSSFKNLNAQVGMQVLEDEREKEDFVKRAIEIAYPGVISRELVEILAEESIKRFLDLLDIGIKFKRDGAGTIKKFPGCFFPGRNTAVIISDLPGAFLAFFSKIKNEIDFIYPSVVLTLITQPEESEIVGLIFYNLKEKKFFAIKAKSVVVALGGCASLFLWNNAYRHPYCGYSMALLEECGVDMVNCGFVQMLWLVVHSMEFFPFEILKKGRCKIMVKDNFEKIPDHLLPLIELRKTHCPIGYFQKDFVLDKMLLTNLTYKGVCVRDDEEEYFIAPFAQAQNGGAKIDIYARTNVNGLFVCGESASFMHGANRIGGAMLLSSQVFGYRAGKFSALYAKEKRKMSDSLFINLVNEKLKGIEFFERDPKDVSLYVGNPFFVRALLIGERKPLEGWIKRSLRHGVDNYFNFLRQRSLRIIARHRLEDIGD